MTHYALTLWPEWAFAICRLGKDVENRGEGLSRQAKRALLKPEARLLIHAGAHIGGRKGNIAKREAVENIEGMAEGSGWEMRMKGDRPIFCRGEERVPMAVPCSAIVASARVRGLYRHHGSPWAVPGQIAWALEDVRVYPHPVSCRGRQGLWIPDGEALAKCHTQGAP